MAGPFGTIRDNLRAARFDRHEIAGSLGDLGTFLPLLTAMASQNRLDFTAAMFFAGLFNLLTGLTFVVPMAVQPMKAIAAVALAEQLTAGEIVAAGMAVSALVLLAGLSGLTETVLRLVPKPVIRGVQLSLGLTLAGKGVAMAAGGDWRSFAGPPAALVAAGAVLLLSRARRIPVALLLFAAGLVLALVRDPALAGSLMPGLSPPRWAPPAWGDFPRALTLAALPQLPLTLLNSVIAVTALSHDLFPRAAVTPRRVAVSVGLMNLAGGCFGAMPMCHGAGGLAGQHRFGARTNGAIIFLGAVKMALALAFGASLMTLCAAYPPAILGVMLLFSGIELALVARDQTGRDEALVMLLTVAAALSLNNIAVGFATGLAASWLTRRGPESAP